MKVREIESPGFKVLRGKPKEGQCPDCAVFHDPGQPHDAQSLYYQYTFYEDKGRWPTWKDALAHCAPEVQALWV